MSLLFSILSVLALYFQKRLLLWVFQTQVSLSVTSVSYLLTSEAPLNELQRMVSKGGILVGIVLLIEIVLLIGISLFLFYRFWQWYRKGLFLKKDTVLVLGYVVLLGSTLYIIVAGAIETWETTNEVLTRLQRLSPQQISLLTKEWYELILSADYSLLQLPAAGMYILEQIRLIINSVRDIAGIPGILNHWLGVLLQLKNTYGWLLIISFVTLSMGHLLAWRELVPQQLLTWFQTHLSNSKKMTTVSVSKNNDMLLAKRHRTYRKRRRM